MCEIASAARVIRRMTAKQPTKPAAAPAPMESAMALGSKVIVNVVRHRCAIQLGKQLGCEDAFRSTETSVTARQTQNV
jgi:hypothetical protein